jgi:hypothetical protein
MLPAKEPPKRASASLILILTLTLIALGTLAGKLGFGKGFYGKVAWLARVPMGAQSLSAGARRDALPYQLPKIKQAVGNHTVDVAGWDQTYAILNDLHYRPAPIFQSYTSAHADLIKLNTDFYQSKSAPDFVLYQIQSLDSRFPTLDNPLVFLELLKRYQPVLQESPFLLLQHRAEDPVSISKSLYSEGEMHAGETMPLPPGPVWCELDLRDTFLGKLFRFFLHTPAIMMETDSPDQRTPGNWRLIPADARAGFLVSPIVQSNSDFLGLFEGKGASVKSIRIHQGLLMRFLLQPKIGYRIYKLDLSPVTTNPNVSAAVRAVQDDLQAPAPGPDDAVRAAMPH